MSQPKWQSQFRDALNFLLDNADSAEIARARLMLSWIDNDLEEKQRKLNIATVRRNREQEKAPRGF